MNRNRWFWPYIILAIAVLCLGIGVLTEKHPAVVYVYESDAKFVVGGRDPTPSPEVVSPVLLVIDEYGNETCQWNYSWGIDVDYCPWVTPVWPTPEIESRYYDEFGNLVQGDYGLMIQMQSGPVPYDRPYDSLLVMDGDEVLFKWERGE